VAIPVAVEQAIDWEIGEQQIGLWRDAWQRFRRNRLALLGAALVMVLVVVAFLAPLLVHFGIIINPTTQEVEHI